MKKMEKEALADINQKDQDQEVKSTDLIKADIVRIDINIEEDQNQDLKVVVKRVRLQKKETRKRKM